MKSDSRKKILSTGRLGASKTMHSSSLSGLQKREATTTQGLQKNQLKTAEGKLSLGAHRIVLSKSMEKSFLRLRNKNVREAYVDAEMRNSVAAQIRVLRQSRGWSQAELAKQLDTTQNTVSRLEDPSYGRFTIKTLLSLASVFDVGLITRFIPFSKLMSVTWDTSAEALAAQNFEEDEKSVSFIDFNRPFSSVTAINDEKTSTKSLLPLAYPNVATMYRAAIIVEQKSYKPEV